MHGKRQCRFTDGLQIKTGQQINEHHVIIFTMTVLLESIMNNSRKVARHRDSSIEITLLILGHSNSLNILQANWKPTY